MPLPEEDIHIRAEIFGTSAHLDIPAEWLAKLVELHGSRHLADPDFGLPVLLGMAKDGVAIVVFRRRRDGEGVIPDAMVLEGSTLRSVLGPKHPLHAAWKMHRSRRSLAGLVFTIESRSTERKKEHEQ